MTPLPDVADVIRCNLHWTVGADTLAQNRLYLAYSGSSPDGTACAALATDIGDAIVTHCAAVYGAHVTLESVQITDLSSSSGGQASSAIASGEGTRSGNPLPSGAAALQNFNIARRYRGAKPKTFWPWLTSADLDTNNRFLQASADSCESAWAAFIGAFPFSSGGCNVNGHVNVSFYEGYTLGPASPGGYRKKIPTPRASAIVDTTSGGSFALMVGSQRRRNRH